MNHDKYIIEADGIEKTIYPLLEINVEDKLFLVYTDEIKDKYVIDDLYVGEEKNENIIPVDKNLIPYIEKVFEGIIKNNL